VKNIGLPRIEGVATTITDTKDAKYVTYSLVGAEPSVPVARPNCAQSRTTKSTSKEIASLNKWINYVNLVFNIRFSFLSNAAVPQHTWFCPGIRKSFDASQQAGEPSSN
jgi:hypothetical protein